VNTGTDCERVRMTLMASLDGESDPGSEPDRQHLSTCLLCQGWLKNLQSMTGQLQGLSYPDAHVDLWTAVEGRIRQHEQRLHLPRRLWPIVAIVLAWRAFELFADLPIPALHPFVPLAAAVAFVWLVAGDPLAIETSAPELQKRGV
jgi:predicted anti-sigma-YlaC factor YlaD